MLSPEFDENLTKFITIEDIDRLLELFQQLKNTIEPSLPTRNDRLWSKSIDEAKSEFIYELKMHQASFTEKPGLVYFPQKPNEKELERAQKAADERILMIAEKKYCEKDSVYAKALDDSKKTCREILKDIYNLLECLRVPLQQYSQTRNTWLVVDFKEITTWYEYMIKDNVKYEVQKSIDALNALKFMFERQRRYESKKQNKVNFQNPINNIIGDTWTISGIPINIKVLFIKLKSHPI